MFYFDSFSPTLGFKLREKRRVRVQCILLLKACREKLHFKSTFKLDFFAPTLQLVISPSFDCWVFVNRILFTDHHQHLKQM